MKKKFILSTSLFLIGIVGFLFLSACSSSDDEKNDGSNKRDKIRVEYSIDLDDNWYKFFDIEMTYKAGLGEKTEKLTEDWVFKYELPYESCPETFVCKVIAKPKSSAPAIEDGKTYSLGCSCNASVAAYFKNGKQDLTFGRNGSKTSKVEYSSANMSKYILKEHTIFTYTLNTNDK